MPVTPPTEYLEVASIPLAWWIEPLDLAPLWDGADISNDDLQVPGASGQRELPQYLEPVVGVIPAVVFGDRDTSGGTVTGDAECRMNLYDNLAYLKDNICTPVGTLPSSRSCTLHLPDGSTTLTGSIRISRRLDVRGLDPSFPFAVAVSLAFKIVLGELVESGS